MRRPWSRREVTLLLAAVTMIVAVSVGQQRRLAAIQLEADKAEYVARVRATQVILEDEMLRSAFVTSGDERVRALARMYLEEGPE